MWCKPEPSSVSPIYMPGLFLTASRPLRTFIESAPYDYFDFILEFSDIIILRLNNITFF